VSAEPAAAERLGGRWCESAAHGEQGRHHRPSKSKRTHSNRLWMDGAPVKGSRRHATTRVVVILDYLARQI
jgi:hypothetical protein